MSEKWKIKKVSVTDILGTEVNANSMSKDDFDKLCSNIQKSGLSSTIACYKRKNDGKFVIISGNHRFKACEYLGYSSLNILYALEEDLSPDEIIAVQLSHNSLHGSDDKGILKRLFDEIQSVEFKEFAHISSDDIQIEDMFTGSIVPISEHYKVSLILYKNDIKLLGELMEIVKTVNDESDLVFLADAKDSEDEFIDILTALKKEFNIKSTSIAFSKLLEIAKSAMIQK